MADIFRSRVRFYGKHARYLEELTSSAVDLPGSGGVKFLFDTVIDVYIIAPIVGFLYKRRALRDVGKPNKNITERTLATYHKTLVFSYRLLMILDEESEPDYEERLRRAFVPTDALAAEGMSIYNEYALGGIEVLYERLCEGAVTPDDLLRNLMDFEEEWNKEYFETTFEYDLKELLQRYYLRC